MNYELWCRDVACHVDSTICHPEELATKDLAYIHFMKPRLFALLRVTWREEFLCTLATLRSTDWQCKDTTSRKRNVRQCPPMYTNVLKCPDKVKKARSKFGILVNILYLCTSEQYQETLLCSVPTHIITHKSNPINHVPLPPIWQGRAGFALPSVQ